MIVSAYADDLNVFVRDQGDVDALQVSFGLYQNASSAKVNWAKSEALQVGQWRERAALSLPAGFSFVFGHITRGRIERV